METSLKKIFENKKILITGHTGFKGSWLTKILSQENCIVLGISLPPGNEINHFKLLNPTCESKFGDIGDYENLTKIIQDFNPEIVFHLAAQSLVRKSYLSPVETYTTNVLGTLNVYEACRQSQSVKVIVAASTDKVYKNKNQLKGYSETDKLGGHDPYSASKACMEILSESYQKSFLSNNGILLATVRAGNVIGGGDWSGDRLIPDIYRSIANDKEIEVRNPKSIRPWQHVLEPLYGYVALAKELYEGNKEFASPWNFGPNEIKNWTVLDVLNECKIHWPKISWKITGNFSQPHEEEKIILNCEKSINLLKWRPIWDTKESIKRTINWYKNFYETGLLETENDLKDFLNGK